MSNIKISKHDFAWHITWTDSDGWGHVRRVATIFEALKIVPLFPGRPTSMSIVGATTLQEYIDTMCESGNKNEHL
jgi:hypothetical protein